MFYREIVISSNRKELYHRFIAVISYPVPGQIKKIRVPDRTRSVPQLPRSLRTAPYQVTKCTTRQSSGIHFDDSSSSGPDCSSIAPSLHHSPPALLSLLLLSFLLSPLHHLFTPPTTTFLNSPLHSFSFLFLLATVLGLNLSRPPSLLNQPCMPSLGSFLFLPTSTHTPSKARHSSHFALSMI